MLRTLDPVDRFMRDGQQEPNVTHPVQFIRMLDMLAVDDVSSRLIWISKADPLGLASDPNTDPLQHRLVGKVLLENHC